MPETRQRQRGATLMQLEPPRPDTPRRSVSSMSPLLMVLFILLTGPTAGQQEPLPVGDQIPTNEEIEALLAEADQLMATISQGLREIEMREEAWQLVDSGDLEGAIALIRQSLALAHGRGDIAAEVLGHKTLGAMLNTLGDAKGARKAYKDLEAFALKVDDSDRSKAILARSRYFLAASRMLDDPSGAKAELEEALELATETQQNAIMAMAHYSLGLIAISHGDHLGALEHWQQQVPRRRSRLWPGCTLRMAASTRLAHCPRLSCEYRRAPPTSSIE